MAIINFRRKKLYKDFRKRRPRKRIGGKSKSYIPRRILSFDRGRARLVKIRTLPIRFFRWKPKDPLQYFRNFNIFKGLPRFRYRKKSEKDKKAFRASRSMRASKKGIGKTKSFSKKKSSKFIRDKSTDKLWKTQKWKNAVGKWRNDPTIGLEKRKIFINNWGSGFSNRNAYPIGRDKWGGKRGRNMFRDIINRMMLGPAGPQKPALIFDIRPHSPNIKNFFIHFDKSARKALKRDLISSIKRARQYIIDKTLKYIDTYVPKDTGNLRDTMLESLVTSHIIGYKVTMILHTGNLKYAKPVNNMSSQMLQHNAFDKKNRQRSRGWYDEEAMFVKNRIHPGFDSFGAKKSPDRWKTEPTITQMYKHDPKAVKGWWGFSVMSARKFAREAYDKLITELIDIFTRKIYGLPPKTFTTDKRYLSSNPTTREIKDRLDELIKRYAESLEKPKHTKDAKIKREAKIKKENEAQSREDIYEEFEIRRNIRLMQRKKRIPKRQLIKVITPSRLDIKRLFKVKFK